MSLCLLGDYDDPNHPNCLRQVKVVGAPLKGDGTRPATPVIEVTGYDGKSGEKTCTDRPTRGDLWKVQGTVNRNNVDAVIDFSPKGGPSNLKATYVDGGIVFPVSLIRIPSHYTIIILYSITSDHSSFSGVR